MLFINESQVAFLEDMMWERGYLDSRQMAGAFQLLRSNDLIWSRVVHDYLMGERSTPDRHHGVERRHDAHAVPHAFRISALAVSQQRSGGGPVQGRRPRRSALHDIRVPVFAVGTEWDHVAPWRSVFKFHFLADADMTFALTNGGHNAGILSEPGHPSRHFRIATRRHDDHYVDPDTWLAAPCAAGGLVVAGLDGVAGRAFGRRRSRRRRSAAPEPGSPPRTPRPAGTF